jgi:hypothetical protein
MTPEMRSQLGPIGAIAGAIALLALAVWTLDGGEPAPVAHSMLTGGDLWLDGGACPSRVELHFRATGTAPLAFDAPMLDRMADCLVSGRATRIDLDGIGIIDEPRARAIAAELEARSVASDLLGRVTYADGKPLCRAGDESCWAKNRGAP